jgi:hypothetical protein
MQTLLIFSATSPLAPVSPLQFYMSDYFFSLLRPSFVSMG